jgi:hypothetical protein
MTAHGLGLTVLAAAAPLTVLLVAAEAENASR